MFARRSGDGVSKARPDNADIRTRFHRRDEGHYGGSTLGPAGVDGEIVRDHPGASFQPDALDRHACSWRRLASVTDYRRARNRRGHRP